MVRTSTSPQKTVESSTPPVSALGTTTTSQGTSTSPQPCPSVGRVKWFNAQSGYGFISKNNQADLFVHHSALATKDDQFRYLVEGEYVAYMTDTMDDGRSTAVAVTGVEGGPLMCETRQQRRDADQQRIGGRNAERRNPRNGKPVRSNGEEDPQLWQVIKAQLDGDA